MSVSHPGVHSALIIIVKIWKQQKCFFRKVSLGSEGMSPVPELSTSPPFPSPIVPWYLIVNIINISINDIVRSERLPSPPSAPSEDDPPSPARWNPSWAHKHRQHHQHCHRHVHDRYHSDLGHGRSAVQLRARNLRKASWCRQSSSELMIHQQCDNDDHDDLAGECCEYWKMLTRSRQLPLHLALTEQQNQHICSRGIHRRYDNIEAIL